MNKNYTIINNIRKLRFNANEMKQQELADLTGVSRQTIIAVETGKYIPSLDLAFAIADIFELDVNAVFMRTKKEQK
jgi:putative transcriptional regulator